MSEHKLDVNDFKVGAFIELKRGANAGLLKIVKMRKLSDGENLMFQLTLDKDIEVPGDETILEFHLNNPREVTIFSPWETFPKASAQGWPPPLVIGQTEDGEQVTFKTFSDAKTDEEHKPFSAWLVSDLAVSGKLRPDQLLDLTELTHFEYQTEKGDQFLSIWEEEGVIYMYRGYSLNAAFVRII